MGLFNIVRGEMTCPRCGRPIDAEVETRLGWVHQVLTLRVGDTDPWNHPDMPSIRPCGGNAVGDGYCECPAGGRDFLVHVVVRNDVIRRLEVAEPPTGFTPS
jgi:uncharacterized protein (UPF0212 family)